ncbi:MAG TPA: N-acetylmuramoyl-L-alanine amidase, partial [Streptosporangiaceae bacterium]
VTTPTTAVPSRLVIDKSGKLRDPSGKASITYNDPWPLRFARAGVTGKMRGALLHTMVGSIESCIATFNAPGAQGSAHIGISQAGRIHQFVPLGQGYETYHAYTANLEWYGIETEDMGHPHTPIADAGLWAWAQVFEFMSDFAGFPCEVTDDCNGRGLAYHRMCADWNLSHHTCPGESITDMVRVNQRAEIVRRAKQIRAGVTDPQPFPSGRHVVSDNPGTLAALAKLHGCQVADIWFETAAALLPTLNSPQSTFGDLQRAYLNAGKWDERMPSGMVLWLP